MNKLITLLDTGRMVDMMKQNTLQWRHNEHGSVSNHRCIECFFNRLFGRTSKKASKLRATGILWGDVVMKTMHVIISAIQRYTLQNKFKLTHFQTFQWHALYSTHIYIYVVFHWHHRECKLCCVKRGLRVNASKLQVVHIWLKFSLKTNHYFQFGSSALDIVSQYR